MEERQSHINLLELKVAFLALQVFASQRNTSHILLRIDNTTAIAYLNKKGGTQGNQGVGVVPVQEDDDLDRAHSRKGERGGRQGVQKRNRLQRLDAASGGVSGAQCQV